MTWNSGIDMTRRNISAIFGCKFILIIKITFPPLNVFSFKNNEREKTKTNFHECFQRRSEPY